eukprot:1489852-Prymnesium_polylepis.1
MPIIASDLQAIISICRSDRTTDARILTSRCPSARAETPGVALSEDGTVEKGNPNPQSAFGQSRISNRTATQ